MSERILIFERNEAVRSRTRAYLEREGFQICAEARDEADALAKTGVLEPDLIIMDLNRDFDLIPELLRRAPSQKILIFTLHEGPEFLRLARTLGAQGYANKADAASLVAEVKRLLDTAC